MDLNNKLILFIGIGFYDYEMAICSLLKAKGHKVEYIISTNSTFYIRMLYRLGLNTLAEKIKQIKRIEKINKIKNADIVFVIKGEDLSQTDINKIKKLNPNAKYILYLWDSLIRHSNKDLLINNFDDIWSFDRKDCEINSFIKFRPLFFRNTIPPSNKIYTLSFIGWMHSDRLDLIRKIKKDLKEKGEEYYFKLYMGRFSYFINRFISHKLSSDDRDLIIFKPVKYSDFLKITSSSYSVLDISHPLQTGLTIRTIETLASGTHLYTTNEDIKNYDQIPSNCYTIINRVDQIYIEQVKNNINFPNLTFNEHFNINTFIDTILNFKAIKNHV